MLERRRASSRLDFALLWVDLAGVVGTVDEVGPPLLVSPALVDPDMVDPGDPHQYLTLQIF